MLLVYLKRAREVSQLVKATEEVGQVERFTQAAISFLNDSFKLASNQPLVDRRQYSGENVCHRVMKALSQLLIAIGESLAD